MKKWIAITAACLFVILLGSEGWKEYTVRKEARVVAQMLKAEDNRYKGVSIHRTKGNYNVVTGTVRTEADLRALRRELHRLGIRRCIMGVYVEP